MSILHENVERVWKRRFHICAFHSAHEWVEFPEVISALVEIRVVYSIIAVAYAIYL